MEAVGGQDNGQMQPVMDQSRPRNVDMDGVGDDGGGGGGVGVGGGGGLSDQQRQPINLSQVRLLFLFVVNGAARMYVFISCEVSVLSDGSTL